MVSLVKRISLALITIGTAVLIMNVTVDISSGKSISIMLLSPDISLIAIFVILLLITLNKLQFLAKILHLLIFLIFSVESILASYFNFFGLGLYLLFVLLLYKYDFLKNRTISKTIGIFLLLAGVIEFSIIKSGDPLLDNSLGTFMFLSFFLVVVLIIYADDITSFLEQERLLSDEIGQLISERSKALNRIESLEARIKDLAGEPLDLDKYNLTPKEFELLRILCTENSTNKEIAYDMGISPGTVKQHLNNIYTKLGVNRRVEVIQMCRCSFINSDQEAVPVR